MPPSIVIASANGEPTPDMLAEVRILWATGGALRLPATTYERALQEALAWSVAMHRDGRDGAIVITC